MILGPLCKGRWEVKFSRAHLAKGGGWSNDLGPTWERKEVWSNDLELTW
jgi:hypothetical protein